jgi:leader peptidase (prepilin peptidase)/N-methyltransferase
MAAWRVAGAGLWWQAAVLGLAVVAVVLAAVDLAERRIPNRVLGVAFGLAVLLLGLDAETGGHRGALARALIAAAVLYAGAVVLLLSARDSLGYGDVKTLAYQGLYTGYLGWSRVLGALLLTFMAAAVATLIVALVRRSRRLAFAPYVLGATLVVMLLR